MKKMKKIMALVLALTMVFTMNLNVTSAKAKKAKVKGVKVTSVTGSKKVAYVAKGKSVKLSTVVNVKPNKKANKAVKYKVSNSKVATVSKKGVVKGRKSELQSYCNF
ncbi:MAG: Ig-like domain-containing protein [Eubacterium sp.]